jgi:hypothetical protein
MLTEFWYGSPRVARALGIAEHHGRPALISERVEGREPEDRARSREFLLDLRRRFDDVGLPTWQIDTRQPSALDNALECADGTYIVIDLESGMVFPLASWRSWKRALQRGHLPMFDTVYFDVTRAYVERHAGEMRDRFGSDWLTELRATIDAGERSAEAWYAAEPRIWGKLIDVRGWKPRLQARISEGHDSAMRWISEAVDQWEADGRLTQEESEELREELRAPGLQAVLPHLGAHLVITIFLRFPFGSLARFTWTLWAMGAAIVRLLARRTSVRQWRTDFSIHNPLTAVVALVPSVGAFAYLLSGPMIENRLLLRLTLDAVLLKVPGQLYERTRLRRIVVTDREAGSRGESGPPVTRRRIEGSRNRTHQPNTQAPAELQIQAIPLRRDRAIQERDRRDPVSQR